MNLSNPIIDKDVKLRFYLYLFDFLLDAPMASSGPRFRSCAAFAHSFSA